VKAILNEIEAQADLEMEKAKKNPNRQSRQMLPADTGK
jgi:hypothetical protein